jgi:multidrug resistance protein, MATE family
MNEKISTWWSRPAGGREVLIVSLPMVISSLSWTVMTFADRVFLNWLSSESMSAAFSASTVWFVLVCLPLGICAYVNTFVSQYYGDKQFDKIGQVVWQGIWFALLIAPLLLCFNWLAPTIFSLADHSALIQSEEVRYFQSLNWGAGGMLVAQAAATFYSGRGHTGVVMLVDFVFAFLNGVLDYLWIFGILGFPAAGIEGAGYATSVAMWLKAMVYVLLLVRSSNRRRFATGVCGINWAMMKKLLYFGGPSGLQMVLDVVGFSTFVVLVSRLGAVEAAATSMAFGISTLAFMPIWGVGMAAGILVGQRLGENRPDLAERASWNSLALGIGYMGVISLLYAIVPQWFLYWFYLGENSQDMNDAVGLLAARLLLFVAAYNLFDALLTILVNALKGAGDTAFVLWVSLTMSIVLGGLSWLAVEVLDSGLYQCWGIIVGWVWVLGIVYLIRFLGGKWKAMRVIEMSHHAPKL